MILKFRIIEYIDESSGIVYTNNYWFDILNIEYFKESKKYGGCLKIFVNLDIKEFFSDSYTGEQLAEKMNEDNERINNYD